LFCVFILIALNTLKFEEIGVHLWIICKDEILLNVSAPKIQYILLLIVQPIDEKQQGKNIKGKTLQANSQ